MKYLFLIALMGLGGTAVMADDITSSDEMASIEGKKLEGKHDVNFDCHFHSRAKKGVSCRVEGEVCVNFGKKEEGPKPPSLDGVMATDEDRDRCDRGRDDNRIRIVCTDGYNDHDRARARIRRERGEGEDLIITARKDDNEWKEDRIEIEEFERFSRDDRDRDRDRDDQFRAKLTRDNSNAPFWGECRVRLERDRDERP
jgi:hypothetical protein